MKKYSKNELERLSLDELHKVKSKLHKSVSPAGRDSGQSIKTYYPEEMSEQACESSKNLTSWGGGYSAPITPNVTGCPQIELGSYWDNPPDI